jgi:hypothetical protein
LQTGWQNALPVILTKQQRLPNDAGRDRRYPFTP